MARVDVVRSCGDCAACCFTHKVPKLHKPSGQWCPLVSESCTSCTKYEERPRECRLFRCAWLDGHFEEGDRPDKIGVVLTIDHAPPGKTFSEVLNVRRVASKERKALHIAELRPGAASEGRARSIVARWVKDGQYAVSMYPTTRDARVYGDLIPGGSYTTKGWLEK